MKKPVARYENHNFKTGEIVPNGTQCREKHSHADWGPSGYIGKTIPPYPLRRFEYRIPAPIAAPKPSKRKRVVGWVAVRESLMRWEIKHTRENVAGEAWWRALQRAVERQRGGGK